MKPITYHPQARSELIESALFYHRKQANLGARFRAAVAEAESRVQRRPASGSPWRHGTRKVRLKVFPFALIYRARIQEILCLAIAHHSRNPDYWQNRISKESNGTAD